jgi:hypothetical protein
VSTDQTAPMIAEEPPPLTSPIENELPTYRAISARAVCSVIFGVLASFSFASLNFLVFAALAVIFGILANRAIRRTPDVLTGTRLANAGIALGLIFSLTVITYTAIQGIIIHREAKRFGLDYARIIKEGSLGEALLLREPSDRHGDATAADKEKELEQMKSRDKMMLEMKLGPLMDLRKAVASKDAQMKFVDVEATGVDDSVPGGVFYFAAVLYELENVVPTKKWGDQTHLYALAFLKGRAKGRKYDWWVDDVRFPYTPKTFQMTAKPVDDGHGHGPEGH